MPEGSWDIVIIGVGLNLHTHDVCPVKVSMRSGDDPAFAIETGDRVMPTQPRTAAQVDAVINFLFGAGGSGGERTNGDIATIHDPVNLDGSPRNALRDRVARRGFENLAAD